MAKHWFQKVREVPLDEPMTYYVEEDHALIKFADFSEGFELTEAEKKEIIERMKVLDFRPPLVDSEFLRIKSLDKLLCVEINATEVPADILDKLNERNRTKSPKRRDREDA